MSYLQAEVSLIAYITFFFLKLHLFTGANMPLGTVSQLNLYSFNVTYMNLYLILVIKKTPHKHVLSLLLYNKLAQNIHRY